MSGSRSAATTRAPADDRARRARREPWLTPSRARWLLGAILVFAFVVRVVYVLQSRANPYFDEPQMDALYHTEWARAFASGRDFQPGPFFRAPLYPWFLGVLFKLFGDGLLLPRLVQSAIGTASVGLVYLVGARAFDRRTGLLAAAFAAGYWVLIYFDAELQLPVLEVPFDLLAIWATLRLDEKRSKGAALLAGAAWGLAALVRPNVLLFVPLLAVWIVWRRRGPALAGWRAAALFAAGVFAPIAPITAYNFRVGGDRVLISSQAGVNLWIGNNPQSDGSAAIVPGTRPDWWGGYEDSIRQAEIAEGRALAPSEVSRHYTHRALDYWRTSFEHAVGLTLTKLWLFWTDYELGNNADERFFAFRFGPILRYLPLGFAFVAALGVVGFVIDRRRAAEIFPLWGFVPVYTIGVVAFFVCSRYRVPVLPALMVFAAHACVYSFDAWRDRRRLAVCGWLACGVVGFALARTHPETVDRTDAKGLWQLGVFAAQHEDPARAAELFQASIAENPRFAMAHHDLGLSLAALGRTDDARRSFGRALELDPTSIFALRGLAYLELGAGDFARAREVAEGMVRVHPTYPEAHYLLARAASAQADALQKSGTAQPAVVARLEEALRAFQRGLTLRPDAEMTFNCAWGAGTVLFNLQRPGEAADAFRTALAARSSPDADGWYWRTAAALAESLLAAGRRDEARATVRELARRFRGDPNALALERDIERR